MENIQFIQITPDELENRIFDRVNAEFLNLKKEFQPKEPTEFLTRNEVRNLLKINLSTVHNWTKRGKLKAYGIAGRVYYKRIEVEAAMEPLSV
jgi:hypothetical protein